MHETQRSRFAAPHAKRSEKAAVNNALLEGTCESVIDRDLTQNRFVRARIKKDHMNGL
jgi:hypothetical protein